MRQWKKVEDALASMNNDCMGGEMIGALKDKNITIVHDPNIKANVLQFPDSILHLHYSFADYAKVHGIMFFPNLYLSH